MTLSLLYGPTKTTFHHYISLRYLGELEKPWKVHQVDGSISLPSMRTEKPAMGMVFKADEIKNFYKTMKIA